MGDELRFAVMLDWARGISCAAARAARAAASAESWAGVGLFDMVNYCSCLL